MSRILTASNLLKLYVNRGDRGAESPTGRRRGSNV
jgi:hypothetical protein